MKALLEYTSPLYLKRLARVLNGTEHGFYASVGTMRLRCNQARFRRGVLECHSLSSSPAWFVPSNHAFEDVYGRGIGASRKA